MVTALHIALEAPAMCHWNSNSAFLWPPAGLSTAVASIASVTLALSGSVKTLGLGSTAAQQSSKSLGYPAWFPHGIGAVQLLLALGTYLDVQPASVLAIAFLMGSTACRNIEAVKPRRTWHGLAAMVSDDVKDRTRD